MRRVSLSATALLSATTACTSWDDSSAYRYAVFSEDGEAIAAIYTEFEEADKFSYTAEQNHTSQVLMKDNVDASAPTAITSLLDGAVRSLYFMRDEGYIIFGRQTGEVDTTDGSSERDIYYEFVELDGTVTTIEGGTYRTMLSCDGGTSASSTAGPLNIIPSPDGTYLAKYEAETDCDARTQTITFLDPVDLSVVDGPYTVPDVETGSSWATVEIGWTDDDVFFIGYWGQTAPDYVLGTAYTVLSDIEEEETAHMSCFYPRTSSSDTNTDGDTLDIDEETGEISTSSYGELTYGCSS